MPAKNKRVGKPEEAPSAIRGSLLWKKLRGKPEYATELLKIRKLAGVLASKISGALPEYTDHSVKHMDALWKVADQVLTPAEVGKFSAGEAFLLGAAFYLHDLGMAAPATEQGTDEIEVTPQYKSALARLEIVGGKDAPTARQIALREATRELHAAKALELATQHLPGLNRFLIEDSDFRDRWGHTLGSIAQSHHWTLAEVERSLGVTSSAPGPDGDKIDQGYVACILRIVDFAHINRERAPRLERMLRGEIPTNSAAHWDAQAEITGPERAADLLVYGCTKPLQNTDAWWLFYDFCRSLDAEIRGVHDYLWGRTASASRFSLKGVRGIESPSVFNQYVRLPASVVPVDIRVHPESMERVVELLGGPRIYGHDELAPIRELIQNARDAIELRYAIERSEGAPTTNGQIAIALESESGRSVLRVTDNGVGMTRSVVQKHLVGVGSDFWNSADFFRDFGTAVDAGFRPIGKFGIGFLSVFMLGDHVEVETEARGSKRLNLVLHGIGRRGELSEKPATGYFGTEVKITLKPEAEQLLTDLPSLIRARAPMLRIPITIKTDRSGSALSDRIEPEWWKAVPQATLNSFVGSWLDIAYHGSIRKHTPEHARYLDLVYDSSSDFGGKWSVAGWPGPKPELIDDHQRLLSLGGEPFPGVVTCSQGVAVGLVRTPDISGIVDLGPVDLTVSRDFVVGQERYQFGGRGQPKVVGKMIEDLRPAVVAKADELQSSGMLPGRIGFLRGLASIFGDQMLDRLRLTWIPVTEPPGNIIHRSKDEFIAIAEKSSRLLLAVGVGPGGAYKVALPHVHHETLGAIPVVAISRDGLDVNYSVQQRLERELSSSVITGSLHAVMHKTSQDESNLVLTRFLLKSVAKAWGVTTEALCEQSWHLDYKDDILWSELQK